MPPSPNSSATALVYGPVYCQVERRRELAVVPTQARIALPARIADFDGLQQREIVAGEILSGRARTG